ncbi:sigma-70 family RNA polymerase sigma factor [Nocardia terpenica]|uniref:sigma-70 family RNA polymerase sigma factor n=1 Tax=Nocardia terpenica TaxID=455432 RepID=UPI00398130E8
MPCAAERAVGVPSKNGSCTERRNAMSVSQDFESRTDRFRPELLVHCYQMLGSVHDAEDLVQETFLRAWRSYERFDGRRAAMRTWLYRIATNACLTALETRSRRPLPSGLAAPGEDPREPLAHGGEAPWLEPFPDTLLAGDRTDPESTFLARGRLRLALVAAMQLLPARQRAVLILRDVLDWSAAEVAEVLDTTPAAVNSALQRARARLGAVNVREDQVDEPTDRRHRALVDRYMAAFEDADIAALARLLTEDAVLEMPPYLNWYIGRQRYTRFIERVFETRGTDWRMFPLSANGQPAVAAYVRDRDGFYHMHTLQVFTVTDNGISRNVTFPDASIFTLFGLKFTMEAPAAPASR